MKTSNEIKNAWSSPFTLHCSLFTVHCSLVFLLLCLSLLPLPTFAQTSQSGLAPTLPSASSASYYYIAKPGELTIQVNLWGFVKNPGRYEVASSTDLVQLISFAGGPADYAKMDEVKITRIEKNASTSTKREIVLDLENLDKIEDSKLALYPGDTIVIGHTAWLTLRDAFNVVAVVAIITTAVTQVISVTRK